MTRRIRAEAEEEIREAQEQIKQINLDLKVFEGETWERLVDVIENGLDFHRGQLETHDFATLRDVGFHQGVLASRRALLDLPKALIRKREAQEKKITTAQDRIHRFQKP